MIFEQVEVVGLVMGIVLIVCIIYVMFVVIYVKVVGCDWESNVDLIEEVVQNGCKDIVVQLIDWFVGDGFEVVMGGGCGNFMIIEQKDFEDEIKIGLCIDGCDLIVEWQVKYNDGVYVWNKEGFDVLNFENINKVFVLFNCSYM